MLQRTIRKSLQVPVLTKTVSYRQLSSWKENNEKSGRPVSPHVTIYAFPIVAVSSIANRGAGVALSVGILIK